MELHISGFSPYRLDISIDKLNWFIGTMELHIKLFASCYKDYDKNNSKVNSAKGAGAFHSASQSKEG